MWYCKIQAISSSARPRARPVFATGSATPAVALSEVATRRRDAEEAKAFGARLNGFNRMNRHDDLLLMRFLAHPAVIEESRASFLRLLGRCWRWACREEF